MALLDNCIRINGMETIYSLKEAKAPGTLLLLVLLKLEAIVARVTARNVAQGVYALSQHRTRCSTAQKSREVAASILSASFRSLERFLRKSQEREQHSAFLRLRFFRLMRGGQESGVRKSPVELALEEFKLSKYDRQSRQMKEEAEHDRRVQLQLLQKMTDIIEGEISRSDF